MKQRKAQKDVSPEIYKLAKAGASVHQILSVPGLRATFEDAERAVQQAAEDNKLAGPAHRANLRNLMLEQTRGAIAVIAKMADDSIGVSKLKPELRLKAAETILKYAAHFMDESVMRSWQERPDSNVELQPTIFDFGPVIEANGEISFRGETKLVLVSQDELDD